MGRLLYLSHPEVQIDPNVPVPDWGLSAVGAGRVAAWVGSGVFSDVTRIVSSAERKAVETAEPIAASRGLSVEIRPEMHENDRSATGFLPPDEFERAADAFFARPEVSFRGWERAVDAQARVADELREVLRQKTAGDLLLVGHGGVGTLLYCRIAGLAIDRRHDQGGKGGNVWIADLPGLNPVRSWYPPEATGSVAP